METKTESNKIHLKVMTPLRVVYDKPVDMAIVRTSDGDMGILYGHMSCLAMLANGPLRIFTDNQGKEEILMVLGGVLTVRDNDAIIVSDMAESPERLQQIMAEMEKERAANAIEEQSAELHTRRMELALRQALVHMDVSAYAILNGHGLTSNEE